MTANELFEKWWAEFSFIENHADFCSKNGAIEAAARQAYIEGYFKALEEHVNGEANNKGE